MKEWHDIKFYTVPEVATMLMAVGHEGALRDELLREIMLCSILGLRESLSSNKPMLIGKVMIQNDPWDVVIHEEAGLRAVHGTNRPLPDPLFIQLKELFVHGLNQPMKLSEWLSHTQMTIESSNEKYAGRNPTGILYLYNRIPLAKISLKEFEKSLAVLTFVGMIPSFKQICVTVDAGDRGMLTWQIYPSIHAIGDLGQKDILKLKELYNLK